MNIKKMYKKHQILNTLMGIMILSGSSLSLWSQAPNIVLGRPTDTSITASIMFSQNMVYFLEYGTSTGNYTKTTPNYSNIANTPDEKDLRGLNPNSQYFYRIQYHAASGGAFSATPEYSFHTQRAKGSSFVFTIEADEHLYDKKGVKNMYDVTLANQALDKPDFMLSLGDIFGDDHYPTTITSSELDALHKDYRPFLGKICHSVPFYVCLGNHEGENDYYYSLTQPNNLCIWGTQWRKYYYPNPFPNSFYSGNTEKEPFGIGNPENYYAWTWGDALFVVLDVYRDQSFKTLSAKPSNWNWTLGAAQYDWLKNTLQNNTSKYKFVFAHHINGQGRGGITNATQFEWGGMDNGTDKFATNRPGWAKPIHQLFKDNGVSVFFQGHDHVFAHETLDGIHYQAVPMPSDSTYMIGKLANADAYVSDTLDGTGHIRVSVSDACVKVEYVKAFLPKDTVGGKNHNGEIAFSYSIGICSTSKVDKLTEKENVYTFPNPASNYFLIQFSDKNKLNSVTLQNTLGQQLLETKSNLVDVQEIPNGIYFLQISTSKGEYKQKIIVQH